MKGGFTIEDELPRLRAQSASIKSTLETELVRAGATYYSDEFAVLDFAGRLHPFATPLSLRVDGGTKSTLVNVEALGGKAGSELLPVGLIAVCRYVPGARWQPAPLTAGQGALVCTAPEICCPSDTAHPNHCRHITGMRCNGGGDCCSGTRNSGVCA